jgi:hypothetical protein
MVHRVTLIQIGESTGIVFPDDVVSRLGLRVGDELIPSETAHGIKLSLQDPRYDPSFTEADES